MTFKEIKEHVMFQTNNDADDLPDFEPHLDGYVNEAYDLLWRVWAGNHLPQTLTPKLVDDDDVPQLPEWTHRALGDWATWLVYRNGNPQKQNRGLYYRQAFEDVKARISDEGGMDGLNPDGTQKKYNQIINIPD